MEAMLIGIPIIATEIRGNKDLISNDINGYLYKPGDIKSLKIKLLKILNNPDQKNKFIEYNKKIIIEKFDRSTKTNDIYNLLSNII